MSHANASSDLLSAVDAVAVISNLVPARPVGALYLQNEDGTRSGKFFFKDGLIYAVKVDGYDFPLAHRAAHSGLIDEDDQRSALASAGGDPSNPLLVSIYLQRHLLDKKTVESYLKENFLAASGVLLSMNPVRAEWRDGEATEDFAVRYIDVPTLVSLCQKRTSTLEMAAERMGTTVEGLFSSPIKMLREVVDEDNLSVEAIWTLHKADGETSLDEAAADLGFTRLYLAKLVYRMWNSGIIEILAPTQPVASQSETAQEPTHEDAAAPAGDVVPLYVTEEDVEPEDEGFNGGSVVEEEEYSEPISLVDESNDFTEADLVAPSAPENDSLEIADPFESNETFDQDEVSVEKVEQSDGFAFPEVEEPREEVLTSEPVVTVSTSFFDEPVQPTAHETPEAPVSEVSATEESTIDVVVAAPVTASVATDDADEDFVRLAQAITNLTERARLANVSVETATRAVEDASAAVRESEEELTGITQVLERLRSEVRAQEERLAAAEGKVSEQRRQEEQKKAEAQQAQAQAARLSERLEKLRSAF